MAQAPLHDVLLVAADLDERRLLLAELRELGYEVLPLPPKGARCDRAYTTAAPRSKVPLAGGAPSRSTCPRGPI